MSIGLLIVNVHENTLQQQQQHKQDQINNVTLQFFFIKLHKMYTT